MEKGGRTKRIAEEIGGLAELGHRVRLVCFEQPPAWVLEKYPHSDDWVVLQKRGGKFDFRLLRALYRETRCLDAQVLHAHCEGSALYAGAVSRLLRRKCIATAHRSDLTYYRPSWKHAAFFHFVDAFVAVSQERGGQMRAGLRIGRRPLRVIHWGVASPDFEETRESARAALQLRGDPVLLGVGHLGHIKGHDDSIRALQAVAGRFPGVHLYIAGDGTDGDYERLGRLISELGLSGNVTLLGQVKDSWRWFAACDVFLQPSREEAFGLVFIEAGLCRRPVIATNIGGIPEIIVDGETGLLVNAAEPDEIAGALLRLLSDSDLSRAIGDAAYHRVTAQFSLKDKVAELAEYFEQTLRGEISREALTRA